MKCNTYLLPDPIRHLHLRDPWELLYPLFNWSSKCQKTMTLSLGTLSPYFRLWKNYHPASGWWGSTKRQLWALAFIMNCQYLRAHQRGRGGKPDGSLDKEKERGLQGGVRRESISRGQWLHRAEPWRLRLKNCVAPDNPTLTRRSWEEPQRNNVRREK